MHKTEIFSRYFLEKRLNTDGGSAGPVDTDAAGGLVCTGFKKLSLFEPYARCCCPLRYGISVLDTFTASTTEGR